MTTNFERGDDFVAARTRITRTDPEQMTDDASCRCSVCGRGFPNVEEFDRHRFRGRCRTSDQSRLFTIRVTKASGEILIDSAAMSLLFGVPGDEICKLDIRDGAMTLPAEWIQQGRRRTSQAEAHTGSDVLLDILAYWARNDHDAQLHIVYT